MRTLEVLTLWAVVVIFAFLLGMLWERARHERAQDRLHQENLQLKLTLDQFRRAEAERTFSSVSPPADNEGRIPPQHLPTGEWDE